MDRNERPDPAMTAEQVASYLGIAVGTVYNKVSSGDIPHFKVGRAVRFRRSEIDAWISGQSATQPEPAA